jgi:asparagine synthase (glutamine-hydrolysing)
MCGICGVIGGDRNQVEPAVRRMMAATVHRGPDDEGYEELEFGDGDQGPVAGFGFRRLAILDLTAAGHQPMFNSATGDCLIFNGEIYNFKSLRAELQLRGILFRGTSDSEVLLQALSTWGEAALEKLQGMYAFAFYEAKTRRVLLARDPLGIKPLYYAALHDRLVFASEIRGPVAANAVRTHSLFAGWHVAMAQLARASCASVAYSPTLLEFPHAPAHGH